MIWAIICVLICIYMARLQYMAQSLAQMRHSIAGQWYLGEVSLYAMSISCEDEGADTTKHMAAGLLYYHGETFTPEEEAIDAALDYFPEDEGYTRHEVHVKLIPSGGAGWIDIHTHQEESASEI